MRIAPIRPVTGLLSIFATLLILAAPAGPALGTTVVPLTLEEMNAAASDVMVGTVESQKAGWDDEHRLIETRVRIRVELRIKGKGGKVIHVVVPGGVVGEIGMRQAGAARFTAGERVLLLAEKKGKADVRPVGLFQGKMQIVRDEDTGIDMVRPAGPAWGAQGQPLPPGKEPKGPPPPLPLDEVLSRLGARP